MTRAGSTSTWSANWAAPSADVARRDTRELVLGVSLALFNDYGEPNVTTNHIADEADISPGNLYYHFRSKDDIVLELFKRFLGDFQPLIDIPDDVLLQADDLWFQLHLSFELKGRFRFLYRNLADLDARIPDFSRAMRALIARERRAARNSLNGLQQAGVLAIDDFEKEQLTDSLLLALTYWIPFSELSRPEGLEDGSAQVAAIARVILMVSPYLRQPERAEFEALARRYLAA